MSECLTEEAPSDCLRGEGFAAVEATEAPELVAAPRRRPYYGWIMLPLSMATLIASSPGQTFGVSILNEPMRLSLGLTHGQLAAAYMLGTLLGALPITLVGHLMDRHGLRRTMLAAVSLFTLACLAAASVQGWLMLVVAFFLLRSLGPGALAFLSSNTLAFWFDRRLGMVEGLRQLGMACAMAAIPALNLWLIATCGWRGAYAWLGIGIWLVLFPAVWCLFRNRPEEVGQAIDDTRVAPRSTDQRQPHDDDLWGFTLPQTLRTSTFWIVASGTTLFAAIHTAVFFCLVPIFAERGLSDTDAAMTLTIYAICYALMQLVGGTLADYVRAPLLLSTGLVGLAGSMLLLDSTSTPLLAQLCGAALGASQGTYFGAAHPLWARYFGRRHLGKIRGALMTLIVASSSVGPLFAGLTRDWSGDFRLALMTFAVLPLPVAALSLLAHPPRRETGATDVEPTVAMVDGM